MDSPQCLPKVLGAGITPELFPDLAEAEILETIISIYTKTKAYPDELQIMDALQWLPTWEKILSDVFTRMTCAEHHINIDGWIPQFVSDCQRRYQREAFGLYASVDPKITDEALTELHERSQELLQKSQLLEPITDSNIDDAFDECHQQLDDMIEGKVIETPFSLEHIPDLSGFGTIHKNELVIIASRPSVGKSSFVNGAVWANIQQGKRGILFNLEMSEVEIIQQIACIESQINGRRLPYDRPSMHKYKDVLKRIHPIIKKQLRVYTLSDSISRMASVLAKDFNKENKPDFICVDYLQLISPGNSKDNRATQVAEITRTLKKWTQQYDCPVIALSQLNRGIESDNRMPRMADLRESGAIEQDANRVILLHRPTNDSNGADQSENMVQEIIAIQDKCRNGATGKVTLGFKRTTTTYQCLSTNQNQY